MHKHADSGNMVIFSMDVTALYPSIKSEMAVKAAKEVIQLSKLEWEQVDVKQ